MLCFASPLLFVQTSRMPPLLRAAQAQGSGGGGSGACCVWWLFSGWSCLGFCLVCALFGSRRAVCLFGCVWPPGHDQHALPRTAVLGGLCGIFMMTRVACLICAHDTNPYPTSFPNTSSPLALHHASNLYQLTRPTHPPHYTSTGRKTHTPARCRDPWSREFAWPSGVREPTSSLPPLLSLL